MAQLYKVQQGDWIGSIAHKFGVPNWQTIWNAPQNQELRKLRQTPNILFPGDQVYVPDINIDDLARATGQSHQFKRIKEQQAVRLILLDADEKPRPGTPYQFEASGQTRQAQTDQQGAIKQMVDADVTMATLKVDDQAIVLRFGHLDPIDEATGVQARLANLGYNPGRVDGISGPKTKSAVMAFQREWPPLKVDGICGPQTRQKLLEVYGC